MHNCKDLLLLKIYLNFNHATKIIILNRLFSHEDMKLNLFMKVRRYTTNNTWVRRNTTFISCPKHDILRVSAGNERKIVLFTREINLVFPWK